MTGKIAPRCMRTQTAPRCFESEMQWKEYKNASRNAPPHFKHGYCYDCLPSFKEKMVSKGRCQHDNVKFGTSKTNGIHGIRPEADK